MDAQKLQVKLYASLSASIDPDEYVRTFHRWIKESVLPELTIDVASYAHVPQSPGVCLIGHGSDYFLDEEKGRFGLLYSRKRAAPPADARLADAFRRALHAALLLEKEPALAGKLRFGGSELLFRINDRLAAPSSDDTFAAVRPELERLCATLFAGAPFELTRVSGPKELFAVKVVAQAKADVATLLARIGGAPSADGTRSV